MTPAIVSMLREKRRQVKGWKDIDLLDPECVVALGVSLGDILGYAFKAAVRSSVSVDDAGSVEATSEYRRRMVQIAALATLTVEALDSQTNDQFIQVEWEDDE